jgi:hypothetical protein
MVLPKIGFLDEYLMLIDECLMLMFPVQIHSLCYV